MKNAFIKRMRANEDLMYAAGNRVGQQKIQDLFLIALNDPDVMGKSVLGYGRLCKVLDAVDALMEEYQDAFDPRKPEADVAREKIDARLRKIVKGAPFETFEERYPEIRKCKY